MQEKFQKVDDELLRSLDFRGEAFARLQYSLPNALFFVFQNYPYYDYDRYRCLKIFDNSAKWYFLKAHFDLETELRMRFARLQCYVSPDNEHSLFSRKLNHVFQRDDRLILADLRANVNDLMMKQKYSSKKTSFRLNFFQVVYCHNLSSITKQTLAKSNKIVLREIKILNFLHDAKIF